MTNGRFTHSLSLTTEQEKKLDEVRKATGYSIVKILMAMVEALQPKPIEKAPIEIVSEEI